MKIDKSRIDVILFDFVGVLLFPRRDYEADPTVEAIDAMIGQVTDDTEFRRAVQTGYQIDDPAFQEILACIVEKYEAYPLLWDLLPRLRQNYRLGIINNGTKLTFPHFDAKLKIGERFDAFISSAEEGVRKPDPRIYLRACQRLDTKPRACLFMDDSEENVLGAQWVGMQTLHWKNRTEGYQEFLRVIAPEL
jgi:HAD superfamily hydrolase (TIGR01509 family)